MAKLLTSNGGFLLLSVALLLHVSARVQGRIVGGVDVKSCYENHQAYHEEGKSFCCQEDGECWRDLQECARNCPCTIGCGHRRLDDGAGAKEERSN